MDPQKQTAEFLVSQGELFLQSDNAIGLEFFKKASELDPHNPDLLFKQATSLSLFGWTNEKILSQASKKLKESSRVSSHDFHIWYLWGKILSQLGNLTGKLHYFLEANKKLSTAIKFASSQSSATLSDLYRLYGISWKKIGEHSQEALDTQLALDAFTNAHQHQELQSIEFWIHYGQTYLDLARCMSDVRLYVKAINCFKHALTLSEVSYEGWTALANALVLLYSHTHDEDHLTQASDCFARAVQFSPQEGGEVSLWLSWAHILCQTGREQKDIKKLRSCIEKCHKAHIIDPNHPLIIGIWAEALALIGEISDRVELIYEAQAKIAEAVQLDSDHPDLSFSHGMCLLAYASYFDDVDYMYQAIEKFQEGLSIDRTCHRHWHAIASAYAHIGQNEEDPEYLERACRFYLKALSLHSSSTYLYHYALALSHLGELTHSQEWLEESILQFEKALTKQKNAPYLYPEWLFHYAVTLDALGDFHEDKYYYTRAIEIFSHVLMVDPDFSGIHHQMALAYSHLADLIEEPEQFSKAIHHYRMGLKHNEEDDSLLLDWGITLINIAEFNSDFKEVDPIYREAEHKFIQSAKMGNVHAFYHLACLYSLQGNFEKSLWFIEKSNSLNALPTIEELLEDDWLEDLRSTSLFREFLIQLEKKPHLHEER